MENQVARRRFAQRVWWQENMGFLMAGGLLLTITLALLGGPLYIVWDTQSRPMLSARGTVLRYTSDHVLIRLGTTSVSVHNSAIMNPGDPVQVFYQVGRSGRIYVASANPIVRKNTRG